MPIVSSICLILALVAATVIGAQTRSWTWGPALIPLALAALAAIPTLWRKSCAYADWKSQLCCILAVAWFAWRALSSSVAEFGHADLVLIASAVAAFAATRTLTTTPAALTTLSWGTACLLAANLTVAAIQMRNPGYSLVFPGSATEHQITGFFSHYNPAASFLIATSTLIGAQALFGKLRLWERLLWGLLAIAGLLTIIPSGSRGGIFGAAVSGGILIILALVHGKRTQAKWFGPAVIAFPVVLILVGLFLAYGWHSAQTARGMDASLAKIFDNSPRLSMLGIAIACVFTHPVSGGGARSFSWESFHFTDAATHGELSMRKPEFVHNEFLQTATDYGIVGAALLLAVLLACVARSIFHISFDEQHGSSGDKLDAWRIGAAAALAGILAQSCFSFVFHLLPIAILLGILLGVLSTPGQETRSWKTTGVALQATFLLIACCAVLLPAGAIASRLSFSLWPVYFGKPGTLSRESKIDRLSDALLIAPTAEFHMRRATILRSDDGIDTEKPASADDLSRAVDDYAAAARLHPFDPTPRINRANLLSALGRTHEAETDYQTAIQLQGGMESAFQGHLQYSLHFARKGDRQLRENHPSKAVDSYTSAVDQIGKSEEKMHWFIRDMRLTKIRHYEGLGIAKEQAGDISGALEVYESAASFPLGRRLYYRAALTYGRMAREAWSNRKPGQALALFIMAETQIRKVRRDLPEGVTLEQKKEYRAHLIRTIKFLKGARITPAELTD
ncbi:MAG: O-antigen ligase family protein [Verrucomicrobiales bacterium]|nr:O-antigen ligase family protein [Verrucomicrobiota bacterium JB025]